MNGLNGRISNSDTNIWWFKNEINQNQSRCLTFEMCSYLFIYIFTYSFIYSDQLPVCCQKWRCSELSLMNKLCNINTHKIVEGCFSSLLFKFSFADSSANSYYLSVMSSWWWTGLELAPLSFYLTYYLFINKCIVLYMNTLVCVLICFTTTTCYQWEQLRWPPLNWYFRVIWNIL